MAGPNRSLSFTAACLCELALLVLAAGWSGLFHRPALSDIQWNVRSAVLGIIAAIPPLLFFFWSLRSNLQPFARHRDLLDSLLRPLFGQWSMLQLFTISAIAGIAEEAFFRGAIQGSLSERVTMLVALVLASALFGACHLLTWTYAIMATCIGVYLGLLWSWTGNLLTPMITHAAYDFAALVYFLRIYRGNPLSGP